MNRKDEMISAEETAGIIKELTDGVQGDISILWQPADSQTPLFSLNSADKVISASVIKTPIMAAALNEVLKGNISLDTMLAAEESQILDDTLVFDRGARQASLHELLYWMITQSDNTSTNILIDHFGFGLINEYIGSLNLKNTFLGRKMLDFEAVKNGINNYTCADDVFSLFRALHSRSILSEPMCSLAAEILLAQRDSRLFRRYIWESSVRIAHKSGGLDYLSHDAGIFYCGSQVYFLGVFMQNTKDIDGEPVLIGNIARTVLNYHLQRR